MDQGKWETVLRKGMSYDMWYHSHGVSLLEPGGFSFIIQRSLFPAVYQSGHSFPVCNELIEMVTILGNSVRPNQYLFMNAVEFHLMQTGIHIRTLEFQLLEYTTQSKRVSVTILN